MVDAAAAAGARARSRAVGAPSGVWEHGRRQRLPWTMRRTRRLSPASTVTLVDRDEAVRADASIEAMAKLNRSRKRNGDRGQRAGRQRRCGSAGSCRRAYARSRLRPLATISIMQPSHGIRPTCVSRLRWRRKNCSIAWPAAKNPCVGDQRSLFDRRNHLGPPLGLDERNHQSVRRSRRDGPSDRRLGRAHRGHAINQFRKRGGGYGIASICSGGGQGDALS